MAAGPVRFIVNENASSHMDQWHLLKTPQIVQTAATAAKLSQALKGPNKVSFVEDMWDATDVSRYGAIMVQVWGVAGDGHAPVIDLYGWSDNGPGMHLGTVTGTMGVIISEDKDNAAPGWHTAPSLHQSLRDAFVATTDYRTCDEYVITADYQVTTWADDTTTRVITYGDHPTLITPKVLTAGAIDTSPEADFPSYFIVDLSRSSYKYLIAACTNLGSATTVGAIFRPLCMRY